MDPGWSGSRRRSSCKTVQGRGTATRRSTASCRWCDRCCPNSGRRVSRFRPEPHRRDQEAARRVRLSLHEIRPASDVLARHRSNGRAGAASQPGRASLSRWPRWSQHRCRDRRLPRQSVDIELPTREPQSAIPKRCEQLRASLPPLNDTQLGGPRDPPPPRYSDGTRSGSDTSRSNFANCRRSLSLPHLIRARRYAMTAPLLLERHVGVYLRETPMLDQQQQLDQRTF